MLKRQIAAQGKEFEETGGFSERLTTKRVKARDQQKATALDSPPCPKCSASMHRRTSTRGDFWGCSRYPDCKGTRPIGQPAAD